MAPGSVGPRIRSLRLQRRLTLKEIADKAHRIVNPGRKKLRCIWAIIPPTF